MLPYEHAMENAVRLAKEAERRPGLAPVANMYVSLARELRIGHNRHHAYRTMNVVSTPFTEFESETGLLPSEEQFEADAPIKPDVDADLEQLGQDVVAELSAEGVLEGSSTGEEAPADA